MHIAKSVLKIYILCDFIYRTFEKKQNYGDSESSVVVRGSGQRGGRGDRRSTGNFRAVKLPCKILY